MNHKSEESNNSANYQELLYHDLRKNLHKIGQQMESSNAEPQSESKSQAVHHTDVKPKPTVHKPEATKKAKHPVKQPTKKHSTDQAAKKPVTHPVKKPSSKRMPKPNHDGAKSIHPKQVHQLKDYMPKQKHPHKHHVPAWLDITLWIVSILILLAATFGIYEAFLNL